MYIEAMTNGMNQEFLLLRYHGLAGVGFSRGSDLMAEGSYVRSPGIALDLRAEHAKLGCSDMWSGICSLSGSYLRFGSCSVGSAVERSKRR